MYSLRMSAWIVPPRRSNGIPSLLRGDRVEGEHHGGRSVDRHRHGDLADVDAVEQRQHVLNRVERDTLAADLAEAAGVV